MSTLTETVIVSAPPTKADKKSKIIPKKLVTLKLSSQLLARFAPKLSKESTIKSEADSSSAQANSINGDAQANGTPADNMSESASTPAPNESANGDTKKKGGASSRGTKRGLGEGSSKSRPRAAPKKRKLDDGSVEPGIRTSLGGANALATHKLGPRANQGAINAGLRALDRSGKPCRKWEKKAFILKSFTGVAWEVGSWKAPQRIDVTNGDANGTSNVGESESKVNESSTGINSEKSHQGDQVEQNGLVTPAPSSPPPAASSPPPAPEPVVPAITTEA